MDSLEAAALRADSAALFSQGATFRRVVNGIAFTWSGAPSAPFCGVFTSLTKRRDIDAGGFELQPDAVLRVDLCAHRTFVPALGQTITVSGRTFKIVEVGDPTVGQEIRIGLGKH